MILGGVAKELKIPLAIPHHTRHIGLSFFSFHRQEIIPKTNTIKNSHIEKAENFLSDFKKGKTSSSLISNNENFKSYISYKKKSKINRLADGIIRFIRESRSRELNTLKVSLLNNWFPF